MKNLKDMLRNIVQQCALGRNRVGFGEQRAETDFTEPEQLTSGRT